MDAAVDCRNGEILKCGCGSLVEWLCNLFNFVPVDLNNATVVPL